ncbi:MAG: Helix-turn-helix domain protein [Amycolatopsis sp.]|uniref:helix-turn-helix transcriptional regulator n=1 Tax=Amycolatopsis sp. TaxID=37632 RepID=UPI00262AC322|nr:helix-turn-helix transcriptional regulator [Amycolatopsis sp.]MCU1682045.1 Helix-turn-helix domain protein [Amycolatopsis sp.]
MDQRSELREFLRSRRAKVKPEETGLPTYNSRRHVPGLRREEVAQLAGISSDYYIRLEQGRTQQVSDSVLEGVANALRLTEDERVHLRNLTRHRPRKQAPQPKQRVRPGLLRMIESVDCGPAYLVGRAMELLAWNPLAEIIFADVVAMPAERRNMAQFVFLEPPARQLFVDWPEIARSTVDYLHLSAGSHPDDGKLAALVGELSIKSDEFRRLWSEHTVSDRTHGVKRLAHPLVGAMSLTYEALRLSDDNDQLVMVFSPEPDSESETSMRLLASWGNELHAPETIATELPSAEQK